MGFLRNFLIKRIMKKGISSSATERAADEILIGAVKEMQQSSKTAQKLLQAKMLRAESKKTLNDINSLSSDEYDDEEEEEKEEFGFQDILKLLSNLPKKEGASSLPKDDYLISPSVSNALPTGNLNPVDILEIAKTLTPEQKKLVKEKFGLSL